jgi:competence protein ComEA
MDETSRQRNNFSRSQHLIAILLAAALFLLWFLFHRISDRDPGNIPGQLLIIVEAAGQVKRPGVYFFKDAPNIKELLAVAGGVTVKGPISDSILESSICTGTRVQVLSTDDDRIVINQDLMAARKRVVLGIPLDANQASAEEFALLPYITAHQAKEIVRLRERKIRLKGLEELLAIRGIDSEDLRKLKSYLIVRP